METPVLSVLSGLSGRCIPPERPAAVCWLQPLSSRRGQSQPGMSHGWRWGWRQEAREGRLLSSLSYLKIMTDYFKTIRDFTKLVVYWLYSLKKIWSLSFDWWQIFKILYVKYRAETTDYREYIVQSQRIEYSRPLTLPPLAGTEHL